MENGDYKLFKEQNSATRAIFCDDRRLELQTAFQKNFYFVENTSSNWKVEKSEKSPCCVIIDGHINTPDKKKFFLMIKKDAIVFEFLKVIDNFYYVQKKRKLWIKALMSQHLL